MNPHLLHSVMRFSMMLFASSTVLRLDSDATPRWIIDEIVTSFGWSASPRDVILAVMVSASSVVLEPTWSITSDTPYLDDNCRALWVTVSIFQLIMESPMIRMSADAVVVGGSVFLRSSSLCLSRYSFSCSSWDTLLFAVARIPLWCQCGRSLFRTPVFSGTFSVQGRKS